MTFENPLIIALDVQTTANALNLVKQTSRYCKIYKVGLELFTSIGPQILEPLKKLGIQIFLDLKLHDIPNTVSASVKSASNHGVDFLTIHTLGGKAMMQAAQEAAISAPNPPKLLGVSILTHHDPLSLRELGLSLEPSQNVLRLLRLAEQSGLSGCVCSPWESTMLRKELGDAWTIVTPGIRPNGASAGDQKRIATPSLAMKNGASYLVVGRPITQAKNPELAAKAIYEEIHGSQRLI